jgi:putative peptide zinc metalloprotease protein
MSLTAPFAGRVVDVAPGLREGLWVGARERLLTVIDPTSAIVEAYAGEEVVHRIAVGARAEFRFEQPGRADVALRVVGVDLGAGDLLPLPLLAAHNGGSIPARPTNQGLVPEGAIYRVVLAAEGQTPMPPVARQMRGAVAVDVEAESLFVRFVRRASALLLRESGL